MAKNHRNWIPDRVDLDWIESLASPLPLPVGDGLLIGSWLG